MKSKKHICRICGLIHADSPWGKDGKTPSFNICQCCGVEFGYEDCNYNSIKRYRNEWILNGAEWFDPKKKTENWSFEIQQENIPAEFL